MALCQPPKNIYIRSRRYFTKQDIATSSKFSWKSFWFLFDGYLHRDQYGLLAAAMKFQRKKVTSYVYVPLLLNVTKNIEVSALFSFIETNSSVLSSCCMESNTYFFILDALLYLCFGEMLCLTSQILFLSIHKLKKSKCRELSNIEWTSEHDDGKCSNYYNGDLFIFSFESKIWLAFICITKGWWYFGYYFFQWMHDWSQTDVHNANPFPYK